MDVVLVYPVPSYYRESYSIQILKLLDFHILARPIIELFIANEFEQYIPR